MTLEYNDGTLENQPSSPVNDKIFYMLNEGMRVYCEAKYSNGTELEVNWFEMKKNKYVNVIRFLNSSQASFSHPSSRDQTE